MELKTKLFNEYGDMFYGTDKAELTGKYLNITTHRSSVVSYISDNNVAILLIPDLFTGELKDLYRDNFIYNLAKTYFTLESRGEPSFTLIEDGKGCKFSYYAFWKDKAKEKTIEKVLDLLQTLKANYEKNENIVIDDDRIEAKVIIKAITTLYDGIKAGSVDHKYKFV